MSAAAPSRLPINRGLLADAINLAQEANKFPGTLTPLWRIRVKGNATAPTSGNCVFYNGDTLTYANTNAPTALQFGFVYNASAGVFSLYDGTADHDLGLGNTSGMKIVFNSNTSQGLIPCVATASASRANITLVTGAAGATATDPSGTAWTLDIECYSSI